MSLGAGRPEAFDDAVHRLAADAAPALLEQVLDESRREAAETVKEKLRAALVEEMERLLRAASGPPVDAGRPAAGSPAPTAGTPVDADRPVPASDSSVVPLVRPGRTVPSGWYVYGITRAETGGRLGTVFGVDGAPVEIVSVADLAAVVSPLTDAAGWDVDAGGEAALEGLAPRARAHEAVLEHVVDLGGVLPLRLGVMFPDIDRLKDVIRERAAAFRHALGALEGHSEWGLTITSEGDRDERGGWPASTDGRDYLSQRRAQRLAAEALADQRFQVGSAIHEDLRSASAAAVVHRSAGANGRSSNVVLRASYLVRSELADAFRERCERMLTDAPSELRLSGELTGPWPAYHFCDVSLEEVPA